MSHQFDSGFFVNEPAWHRLGTVVKDFPNTAEALKLSGLDWQVEETFPSDDDGVVPGYKILRRSDNKTPLSIMKASYHAVDNAKVFEALDPFVIDGDLMLDCAVSLDEGRKVAVTARIKDGIADVGKDPVEAYLVAFNSHDGSVAFGFMFSSIRVVCANTLGAAMKSRFTGLEKFSGDVLLTGDRKGVKVRHTKSITNRLSLLPEFIDLRRREFKAGIENFKAMQRTPCDTELFRKYLRMVYDKQLYCPERQEHEQPEKLHHYQTLAENFEAGIGSEIPGYRGTLWGAFQAITQYETHQQGRASDEVEKARKRLNRLWFGEGERVIARAQERALMLCN